MPAEIEIITIIIFTKRKRAVSIDNSQPDNNSNSKYKGDAAQ